MFTFLKKLFGNDEAGAPVCPETQDSPYKDFTVEHYPATGKYFPKYKGRFMNKHFRTGIIELHRADDFYIIYADSFRTEEEAWKHVDLFREQQLKENVRILRR